MYKSLNDPEGLQDSIIEMTKKFTFFDEKSKSFKINPEGMLMLRDIGAQAGLSSAELSKMAVNAAELDDRISKISPSFEFESEDDKMYIANIAKMGAGGEYEVTIKDEKGKPQQILLQEATNEQLQELIDAQRQQQDLTLEELQRAQLDLLRLIEGELISTRDKFIAGVATSDKIVKFLQGNDVRETAVQSVRSFTEKEPLNQTIQEVRELADKSIGELVNQTKILVNNEGKVFLEEVKPIFQKLANIMEETFKPLTEKIEEILKRNGMSLPTGFSTGGYVSGPGNGTSDSIPTLLSNGEFVVNAESTSAFGSLLENINSNPNLNLTEFTNEKLQLKNTNDIASSTTITSGKLEFGEIPPLRVVFEKGPGFTDNDMAMLEFNLGKESITQQLTQSISEKLKVLQQKES
jgi:hypothetical protein